MSTSETQIKKRLYTMRELTAMGCGGHSFLYEQANKGLLKTFKAGGRRVVDSDDLDAWIADRKAESQAA